MKFACPNCGQRLAAEADMVGRQIVCPACSGTISVPALAAAPVAAPVVAVVAVAAPQVAGEPAPVASIAPASAPVSQPASPKRRVPVLAMAAVLVALLAVGGWFLTRGKSGGMLSLVTGPAPSEVKIFPTSINLSSKGDRQSIVVQAIYPDGLTRDVTTDASYTFANKSLVRFEKHVAYPTADGSTELTVKYGGQILKVPVMVDQAKVERPISFRLDVMPVFMKAGCNSGSCHGSSRGKDGFRLSLFGYDPDGDYFRLTRESIGRRVNLALPEESLMIEKGLGRVPHGGGERFKADSELNRTLLRWLEAGALKDGTNVAKVTGLEINPRQAVLEGSNTTQRLTIRATYSDGTDRDVTTLAAFFSNNEPSARVTEDGMVKAGQRGEAFVSARFDTFTVGAQVIVIPKNLRYNFPDTPENNYIDGLVYNKLKKLRMAPSGTCDDSTFLRRVYIDITGTLPTPQQVREFADGQSAGKRAAVIDSLLERKEFADLWVMKFAELLQIRSNNDQFSDKAALLYYNWLQDKFLNNVPIDKIVQELLTASGGNFKNPASSYFQIEKDTLKTSENVAQVFMGMRIQCSQCHNHPFDRWTMNDYYSFAAFFPQVGRKPAEDPRETVIFDKGDGDVKHPVNGKTMSPKFLGGAVPEIAKGQNRREVLAKWIASPENPYFAKNMANIVWAHFLGKGIIDPVDDVRVSNPASNPELLETLGTKFTEYKYDFKKLVRDICNSRTYQLASMVNDSNALDDRNFSHAAIRRMRAEVLLDCISEVTVTKDKFKGLPRGSRSVEIADGTVNNYFLTTFGRATRGTVCSCEVRVEPNLSQALHLLNGDTTQGKVAEGGVVKKLLAQKKTDAEVIEDLYLRCLARKPTAKETAKLNTYFKDGKNQETVLNDVFWALLNSKEFIFNH